MGVIDADENPSIASKCLTELLPIIINEQYSAPEATHIYWVDYVSRLQTLSYTHKFDYDTRVAIGEIFQDVNNPLYY